MQEVTREAICRRADQVLDEPCRREPRCGGRGPGGSSEYLRSIPIWTCTASGDVSALRVGDPTGSPAEQGVQAVAQA